MVKLRPQTGGQGTIRAPVGHLCFNGEFYVVSVPLAVWIKALLTKLELCVVSFVRLGGQVSRVGGFRGDGCLGATLALY